MTNLIETEGAYFEAESGNCGLPVVMEDMVKNMVGSDGKVKCINPSNPKCGHWCTRWNNQRPLTQRYEALVPRGSTLGVDVNEFPDMIESGASE